MDLFKWPQDNNSGKGGDSAEQVPHLPRGPGRKEGRQK